MTSTTAAKHSLDEVLAAASSAARPVGRSTTGQRSRWLRAIADALDDATRDLVPIAMAETHLPETRLTGEVRRTTFQARLIADRLDAGDLTDVTIDPADPKLAPWTAPRPAPYPRAYRAGARLRGKQLPVRVQRRRWRHGQRARRRLPRSSQSPPGHSELSRRTASVVSEALAGSAPAGAFSLIEGEQAGTDAVRDPRIKAVAFTGSTRGGRALFDLAAARPDPIPFYGELGSTNPVVVTPRGWAHRPDDIAVGFAGSVTLGSGQFCTKPGIVFVPDGVDFLTRVPDLSAGPLLNKHIERGYLDSVAEMARRSTVGRGTVPVASAAPVLFRSDITDVGKRPELLELEMFGPAALIVDYSDLTEVMDLVDRLPGQLTATVHGADTPDAQETELIARLAEHAGRVLWNDWPTGVSVTDAQQHGGPYPATTSPLSTSVGPASVQRFLRPVTFQNVPRAALPPELRDVHTDRDRGEGSR